jgi:HK97 family phage prohead protease
MSNLEIRQHGDGWTMTGYGSTFNDEYQIGGEAGFTEVVRPGAFTQTLRESPRVDLLINHGKAGSGLPLATTTNGSMTLDEDNRGLRMEATLIPQDPDAQLVKTKRDNGLAQEMSFSFKVRDEGGQRWSKDYTYRELLAVDIHRGDLSVCDRGANSSTSFDVRGRALAERIGLEVRGYTPGGLAVVQSRREFTDKEKAALGKQGLAVYYDGSWHYPTPTKADYDNAVQSIGRTPGKNRTKVRRYLINRAKAEGWPIPPTWNSDGTVKRSYDFANLRELRRQAGLPPGAVRLYKRPPPRPVRLGALRREVRGRP